MIAIEFFNLKVDFDIFFSFTIFAYADVVILVLLEIGREGGNIGLFIITLVPKVL